MSVKHELNAGPPDWTVRSRTRFNRPACQSRLRPGGMLRWPNWNASGRRRQWPGYRLRHAYRRPLTAIRKAMVTSCRLPRTLMEALIG
jgi:hypothetical protein